MRGKWDTQPGCKVQTQVGLRQGSPVSVRCRSSMWDGSARDRTSSESDPAGRHRPCDHRVAFPRRLTDLMEWNLTSGGERLGPWLQGKDTSTTLTHSSRRFPQACRENTGFYFPPESAKTDRSSRRRRLLYDRCQAHTPFRRSSRSPVRANTTTRAGFSHGPPPCSVVMTRLIYGGEVRRVDPSLAPSITVAIWSPETGIMNLHSLVQSLEKNVPRFPRANLVYSTQRGLWITVHQGTFYSCLSCRSRKGRVIIHRLQ